MATEEGEGESEVGTLLKEIRDALEQPSTFEITYPAQGGTKTINAGDTGIDFYTGEVYPAGEAEEKLSQSLRSYGVTRARSLFIETTKQIVIQLDDGGKHTVEKLETILWNHLRPFRRLTITATESTNIKVVASTNPTMVLHRNFAEFQNFDILLSALRDALVKSGANVKQNKSAVTAIDNVTIAASGSNTSSGISLADVKQLAITVAATYNASATQGITVYVYSSYDNSNYDTDELTSFSPSFTAGATVRKTAFIDPDAAYIKIKVTNEDSSYPVTEVTVTLTETKETIENA